MPIVLTNSLCSTLWKWNLFLWHQTWLSCFLIFSRKEIVIRRFILMLPFWHSVNFCCLDSGNKFLFGTAQGALRQYTNYNISKYQIETSLFNEKLSTPVVGELGDSWHTFIWCALETSGCDHRPTLSSGWTHTESIHTHVFISMRPREGFRLIRSSKSIQV